MQNNTSETVLNSTLYTCTYSNSGEKLSAYPSQCGMARIMPALPFTKMCFSRGKFMKAEAGAPLDRVGVHGIGLFYETR